MGRRKRRGIPLSGDGLRLEALIDIILRCHPMSLRILAGEYEPTTDELSEILACLSRGEIDVPRGVVRFFGSSEEEGRVIRAEVFEGVLGKVGAGRRCKAFRGGIPEDLGHHRGSRDVGRGPQLFPPGRAPA